MQKIVIIPHHPIGDTVKIRLGEVARVLARTHTVFVLGWRAPSRSYTLWQRVCAACADFFRFPHVIHGVPYHCITIPLLHGVFAAATAWNSFWLMQCLRRIQPDIVINGSYHMVDVPRKHSFRYIFDFADYPAFCECAKSFESRITCAQAAHADQVTVVSKPLAEYVQRVYGRLASVIPNGAYVEKIRAVTQGERDAIRDRYGLRGKWIIGYTGYIGSWVEVALVANALGIVQRDIPQAHVLWVGGAPDSAALIKQYGGGGMTFTGALEGDIEPYIAAFDIALLPHQPGIFQDMAFHIKVIEYTAARKHIVSARLAATQALGFPNIVCAGPTAQLWAQALVQAQSLQWDSAWDSVVEQYRWEIVSQKFTEI